LVRDKTGRRRHTGYDKVIDKVIGLDLSEVVGAGSLHKARWAGYRHELHRPAYTHRIQRSRAPTCRRNQEEMKP